MARGRRKKGQKIDGWLVLDKPLGAGSTKMVSHVRWAFNAQKAGHAGTLDPLASGVLPIALGEATKTVPYLLDATKGYEFAVTWGAETDTLDSEGDTVAASDVRPTCDQISAILSDFTGEQMQMPPAYSALKVDGQRAYDLARKGVEVALKARPIEIYELSLSDHNDELGVSHFHVTCSKGTYVRALARDLAYKLGTCGHVTYLRRTRHGCFTLDDAISLEKLDIMRHSADACTLLRSLATVLDDIPALALSESEAAKVRQGQALSGRLVAQQLPDLDASLPQETGAVQLVLMLDNSPVAIGRYDKGAIRPERVFNLD